MYYLLLLLVIIMIAVILVFFNVDIKKNKYYLLIVMMILTLFLSLRGPHVGLDMDNYNEFFIIAKNNSFGYLLSHVEFELGFKWYTKFITLFSGNFRVYIFVTSLLSMIGIYFFILKNSKNFFSSVFIYVTFNYYIYNFCTLRQALAISILLIAFNMLCDKKNWKFIILTLFASLFHKTSIVFLMLYFAKFIPNVRRYINVYLVVCLVFFFMRKVIIDFFTSLVYSQYIGYHDMSGSGYVMLLLIFSLIFFFANINHRVDINDGKNKLLFLMLTISLPFQILSLYQGLLARIVLYFSYSIIILIPEYIEKINDRKTVFLELLYYFLLTAFFAIEIIRNSMYVPYTIF